MKKRTLKRFLAFAIVVMMLTTTCFINVVSANDENTQSVDVSYSEYATSDCFYYFLNIEAPETAKIGEQFNVVFTVKNIKEELAAVEFFFDFDVTIVDGVIKESETPMDAFMTKTPIYVAEIFGKMGELPAMEQICYYNPENNNYECRFLDLMQYPGIVGEKPSMLVNDGDLVVTIPFVVLDTAKVGDEATFSLIPDSVRGTTSVEAGLVDVPGTGDSATVKIVGNGEETSEDVTSEDSSEETSEVTSEVTSDIPSEGISDVTSEETTDDTTNSVLPDGELSGDAGDASGDGTSSEDTSADDSSVADDVPAEDSSVAIEDSSDDVTSEKPIGPAKPGDAGLMAFAVLLVLALAAVIVCKKTRRA